MIVTKENVAAYAFAKHFLRLGLPDSINSLVGRLVGYVELQKGPANKTDLDVPPAFRNDVLRSKKVLIGCGGGYHQECSQPYSPVAKWIEEVDVALNDEGQQYGNLDEASAIARTPRRCIIIWCGDHKQTPGGYAKQRKPKPFGESYFVVPSRSVKAWPRSKRSVGRLVVNFSRGCVLQCSVLLLWSCGLPYIGTDSPC